MSLEHLPGRMPEKSDCLTRRACSLALLACALALVAAGCDGTPVEGVELPKKPVPELPGFLKRKAASKGSTQEIASARRAMVEKPPKGVVPRGDEFFCEKDGAALILIPEGYFCMGSEGGDPGKGPPHEVFLDAFFIGRDEVTRSRFARYLNDARLETAAEGLRKAKDVWAPDTGTGELPATGLSWTEAAAYAQWAGGRLPTEAQWEAAARAGKPWTYPWGTDPPTPGRCNSGETGPGALVRVGSLPDGRSAFGCMDMCGNAAEWCLDFFFSDAYAVRGSLAWNPVREDRSSGRVIRGGGYVSPSAACTVTARAGLDPETRLSWVGFRVAITPKPAPR